MKTPETQQTETMQVEATRVEATQAETRARRQREGGARRASGSQASGRVIPPLPANRARRRRRRSNRRALSTFLIIAGIALLLVAAGMWGRAQLRYRKQDQINQKLATYAKVYDKGEGTKEEERRGPEVDWEGLKAVNPDVVGWVQIPGTQVNYPVYQAKDNDRYLRYSAEGEWSVGGQLFLDCDNTAPGLVDPWSLIYGHHLLDGSMFTQVAELDQQKVFDATDTVWYVTEKETYECEPLMVFYVHADDLTVRSFRFDNTTKFHEYLNDWLSKSVTKRSDAEQIIAGVDHVLCLATCNYYPEYENHGRTIVVCVPKSEANAATGNVGV